MYSKFEPYRRALLGIGPILFHHVFVLVNGIIFSVAGLLIYFDEVQAGIFLGIIVVINTLIGIGQDFRARVSLEKLQLLTALRITRINLDGTEESVPAETVQKGERIKLKPGDQVPCDGTLLYSHGFEISEALITGESDSFPKQKGDVVLGGTIVTAGIGEMHVEKVFAESQIAKMTEDIKKYSLNPSPIQRAVDKVVLYSGYALVVVICYVIIHGQITGESGVTIINDIGALASMIVPQGLVVVTTLLFAFGAASYSRQQVLFQEINATEKLGRIKNLCMDKTGTLTENTLVVEDMHVPDGNSRQEGERLTVAYIKGSGDTSQTIGAVDKFLKNSFDGEVGEILAFSSWRQYGGVSLPSYDRGTVVLVGAPDGFLPYVSNPSEQAWLEALIAKHAQEGKRVLCVVRLQGSKIPRVLDHIDVSVVCAFVFRNNFRAGAKDAVRFFQDRGVQLRILSGDNVATVRTIAAAAGIAHVDHAITGAELEKWTDDDYRKHAAEYVIFARIKPEQKAKIIEALKEDGFTAMVGDGANDALAIKKADLGIAMFDGAAATRQIAAVVLTNNSFTALPGGVRMADNFIRNIEIFASVFLYQSLIGFFLFLILAVFGHSYPLTPLNVTVSNYITVGFPGILIAYWAVRPRGKVPKASTKPFLSRIMPFTIVSALIGALGTALIFLGGSEVAKVTESNTLVLCAIAAFGYTFFLFAPKVFRGTLSRVEYLGLAVMGVIDVCVLYGLYHWPLAVNFFTLNPVLPPAESIAIVLLVVAAFNIAQYVVTKGFTLKESHQIA